MNKKSTIAFRSHDPDGVGRRSLPHDPPLFVDPAKEVFFITICCRQRRVNQLCHDDTASVVFDAARFYVHSGKWFIHVLLLMPDHLHALVSFPPEVRMRDVIAHWKRYTARRAGIQWQRDFFDHRLRSGESREEKANYIFQNPLRAGLAESAEQWRFVLFAESA